MSGDGAATAIGAAATSCRGMGAPRSLPNNGSLRVLHRQTLLPPTAESLYEGMEPLPAIDVDERKLAPPTYADTPVGRHATSFCSGFGQEEYSGSTHVA
jgi:hypothetical protein